MHAYLEDAGAMVAGDALLSAALASMPYGFTIWNEDLRLAVWNDTYLAMYHLPREAIHPGMTLRDVAAVSVRTGDHGDLGIDEIAELYRTRFLHSPGAKVFEHKVRERNIRSTNTRMPGIGWVVTHQDVTEEVERNRLAAAREAALAQEAMRFEAAVNNMAQGLAMFDADRRMVICNSTFAAMYSLPPALVQPGTPLDAILEYRLREGLAPPADVNDDTVNKRVTAARQQGRPIRFIEEEQGRIISVIHQPMQDGGWVSTHQDITEQRQREELIQARTLELEVQNIRFDAAINNMLHGLSMFDAQNRLIVCNRQYAQLYGLPAELTKPGTSFWQMLEHGEKTGMVSIADGATRRKVLGAVIEAGQPVKQNVTMVNGRVIAILHQPMVGGGWISTHEDVTEQHKSEEMIRHLARHDALTNLPNRVLFREEMAMLDNRIRRGERMAVLCVDLDRFKAVNDSLGHAAGDRALKVAAQRLREAARDKDIVARLGGDEFAVLAGPFENPRHAGLIAQRIVKAMEQPINLDGHVVVVGASVGIAVAPVDGEDAETLLRNADLALYRAKNDGRSGYHFFERGMDEALKHRRSLELGLKRALGADEFRLVFQPEIGLGDGRISSLEALLRWDHPDRGMIEPGEFIPIAEETGMMVSIGAWVVREACRTAAAWP
ncbi:MAG TPA: PAS-domain containing protein, partial [Devosiaceae bacterium]|nr:PAS-domain containing protein [Devosiaceae bacterium]